MKGSIKIAELATFFYAILFFGALCITMSYYITFGLNISTYFGVTEILLLFLSTPTLYLPIMVYFMIYLMNITECTNYKAKIKNKANSFSWAIISSCLFSFFVTWSSCIVAGIKFNCYKEIFFGLVGVLGLYLSLFSPSILYYSIISIFMELIIFVNNTLFCISKNKNIFDKYKYAKKHSQKSTISDTKKKIRFYNLWFKHKKMYNAIIIYILIIFSSSVFNESLAKAYISGENNPGKNIELYYENNYINTLDNPDYFLIGESNSYLFIYNRTLCITMVIPRNKVSQINYFPPSK